MNARHTRSRFEFFLPAVLGLLLTGCFRPDEDWNWLIAAAPVIALALVFVALRAEILAPPRQNLAMPDVHVVERGEGRSR